MSLERRYRRLLRAFPPAWRRRNEDALIATLLDAAEPGQTRVGVGDSVDLLRTGVAVRGRLLLANPRLLAVAALAVFVTAGMLVGVGDGVSIEFLATSLVVVLTPGTGVVYTVSSALAGGWQRGVLAAVGCTLGIVPHMAAAMLGLSGVMQAGATAFEIVRWAGVAYLAFMGLSMLRGRGGVRVAADREGVDDPARRVVVRGVALNLLNPKLTVFFFAFLPQFLDSSPAFVDLQLVALGAVFMLMTFAVFAGYAYASAAVRERVLGEPRILQWVQRVLGTVLVGFAARLATTNR